MFIAVFGTTLSKKLFILFFAISLLATLTAVYYETGESSRKNVLFIGDMDATDEAS